MYRRKRRTEGDEVPHVDSSRGVFDDHANTQRKHLQSKMNPKIQDEQRLILVGGLPGSGKTHVGKEIARGRYCFIDKDTVSRFSTESMLDMLGCHPDDRESIVYLDKIRPIEYETMMKIAHENLDIGQSVVCSAPFIREFRDEQWLSEANFNASVAGCRLILVWIHSDETSLRKRLIERNASRDRWKLAHWDDYIKSVDLTPPSVDGVKVIENSENLVGNPIDQQLARLFS